MHLVKRRAHEFGVRGVNADAITMDLAATVARKDAIVQGILDGIYKNLDRNKNITFIKGRAEFTSPVDIRVNGTQIAADKSVLAVGSHVADADIPGLTEAGYITNYEALKLEKLPESMIVIGTGYVGVEFAQMYARYGTKMTLVGRAPRIMPKEEPELSKLLGEILEAEGIELCISANVVRAGVENGRRFVVAEMDGSEKRFEAEIILLAAGRVARVDDLGLEQVGIEMDGAYLKADDELLTTAPNIWSLGDANGGYMFTHRATYDGAIAALNAVRGLGKKVDYRVVPRAVFTEPALASVGMSEQEAREAGREIKIGVARFAGSGRAKAIGQREGLVKLIVDAESDVLLGGHILGAHADILIHQVVTAMYNNGTAEAIAKSIHIHPTLSEVVKKAAKAAR